MAYQHLDVRHENGVDWVTMNRPEQLNALNKALVQDLNDYFGALNTRSPARVVVLRGAGRAFSAGLDLKEAMQRRAQGNPTVSDNLDSQHAIRDIALKMRRCPQPIISIVQGSAAGGGFALALASDVRLVTPDARMNAAFIRIGLSACDIGVSYFLPRMVGASVAAEYMLTGRFIDAQRAYQLGLVSRITPPEDIEAEARSFAADMLHATPLGLRLTKEALGHAIDANSMEAVIAMEDRNQILCTRGEDFNEGIRAFFEKRPPSYAGR
jgi:enoyl-CoA hydratase/carnithine racemase